MPHHYAIVPIRFLQTMRYIGHNRWEQWAVTGLGEKPDGTGWREPPSVDTDLAGNVRLIWKRASRIDGPPRPVDLGDTSASGFAAKIDAAEDGDDNFDFEGIVGEIN